MPFDWRGHGPEIALLCLPAAALVAQGFWPQTWPFLAVAAMVATVPLALDAIRRLLDKTFSLEIFSVVALVILFLLQDWRTAAAVALIVGVGRLLRAAIADRLAASCEAPLHRLPAFEPRIGDVVAVSQGETVPADGRVVQGVASLGLRALNGSPDMTEVLVGDPVLATSVVKAGSFKMIVSQPGKTSAVAQLTLLAAGQNQRPSPPERIAETLSGLLVATLGLGGLGAWVFGKDPAVVASLFLAASAGALLAVPMTVTAARVQAARRGAGLKGPRWLHALSRLNILVLDKTAGLTYADVRFTRLDHDASVSDAYVWECVAVAEKRSQHAVGRALFRESARHIGLVPDPDVFDVFPRRGVRAQLSGRELLVGTAEFLRQRGISLEGDWLAGSTSPIEGTVIDVFVALDGWCLARLRLEHRPRARLRQSLEALRGLGVSRQVLFTNDTVRVAAAAAQAAGVHDYRPSMSAEDRRHEIGRLMQEGVVGMISEGAESAPAMARAHASIILGPEGLSSGADVVLLTDDLASLPDILPLVRRTRVVVWQLIGIWTLATAGAVALVLVAKADPLSSAIYHLAMDVLALGVAGRVRIPA